MTHSPAARKRVCLLVGDFCNLGDAFLAIREAKYLARRFGQSVTLAPYADIPAAFTSSALADGIPAISMRQSPWRFLRNCIASDIVIGGGHALRERVSFGWLALAMLGSGIAHATGGSLRFAGIGATPVVSQWKRRLWRGLLDRAYSVGCRDANSIQVAASLLSRPDSKVSLTNDVAYLGGPLESTAGEGGRTCLISPAFDAGERRSVDAEWLAEIMARLVNAGLIDKIVLQPHDFQMEAEITGFQRLKESLARISGLEIVIGSRPMVEQLLASYRAADIVFTGRLHGLIVASLLGKSVVWIEDESRKLAPFAERFGYAGCSTTESAEVVAGKIARALQTHSAEKTLRTCHQLAVEAERNFSPVNSAHPLAPASRRSA